MEKKKKNFTDPSAFIIAGVSSGSGKTLITLGIMESLRRRNLIVQPFKAGPDYIDPGHHSALLKRPSYNLDTWMMGNRGVRDTFLRNMTGADIGVIEGVMGLFDGKDGLSDEGSTAGLSKLLNLPVLLVIDASKTARSAGAIIKGFESFDPRVNVRWVVFNKVASPAHCKVLRDSAPRDSNARVLGCVPRDESLSMPERHLGLVTSADIEGKAWKRFIGKAASFIEKNIDLKSLLKGLPQSGRVRLKGLGEADHGKPAVRIAVARDKAFCFYYEENLELLRGFGARIVFFSPLKDKGLPPGINGVYLGGGYPELRAKELQANLSMREELKSLSKMGLPIYAECGGLMYLGKSIVDTGGKSYSQCGVFPWRSRMLFRRKALGYREVQIKPSPILPAGGTVRGHEYHYSEISNPPSRIKRIFSFKNRERREVSEGYLYKNTLASYIHIHFGSNPAFASGFVKMCGEWNARLPALKRPGGSRRGEYK